MNPLDISLSELMVKDVITLRPEDSLQSAREIFERSKFHHLPVINRENIVVGILSNTDLDRASYGASLFKIQDKKQHNQALFRSLLVQDVMTSSVFCMSPQDTFKKAYTRFKDGDFRAIPIVEDGELKGIVTPLDLIEKLISSID